MAILLGGGGEGGRGGGKVAASCYAAFLLSSTVLGFLYKKNSSSHKDAETNCNYSIRDTSWEIKETLHRLLKSHSAS